MASPPQPRGWRWRRAFPAPLVLALAATLAHAQDVPAVASAGPLPEAAPYSIGEPTDEEQLLVEWINRARMDPAGETVRLLVTPDLDILIAMAIFQILPADVIAEFATLTPVPPVSIHPKLTLAARSHSADMDQNGFESSLGSDGSTVEDRLQRVGYPTLLVGENVSAASKGLWYGHVAFEVDWIDGPRIPGDPPRHRNVIHDGAYREVGIGRVPGSGTLDDPEVITQVFATSMDSPAFITGVVYFDHNGDGFYDLGEGIGGVTVRAEGVPAYAVTARSGGYSIPVATDGTYTVVFQVPGLADVTQSVTVTALASVKLDHRPPYTPPALEGATEALVGTNLPYTVSPVPAATAYDWRSLFRIPWDEPDDVESVPGLFTASTSPGYLPRAIDVRHGGLASYHLAHPTPPAPQYLTLSTPLRLGIHSELSFQSRLGVATANQVALVQVSTDSGRTWTNVWSQAGNGSPGETTFQTKTVDLVAYAGRVIALRFAYEVVGDTYFPQASTGVGWYLDDILVTQSERLSSESIQPVTAGTFGFRPTEEGDYLLQARARIGDRLLDWGPGLAVTARAGMTPPPVIRLGSLVTRPGGAWELAFQLMEGAAGQFEVETSSSLDGPWEVDPSAIVEVVDSDGAYRARLTSAFATSGFIRVVAR